MNLKHLSDDLEMSQKREKLIKVSYEEENRRLADDHNKLIENMMVI